MFPVGNTLLDYNFPLVDRKTLWSTQSPRIDVFLLLANPGEAG